MEMGQSFPLATRRAGSVSILFTLALLPETIERA
jgi:hypothetical protein